MTAADDSSPAPVGRPPIGRPRDSAKRAAMLQAAHTAFFAQGYAATSLEAVADAAGVSKVTLYGHFSDKDGLFEAVVRNVASRIEHDIASFTSAGDTLERKLTSFGRGLMGQLMSPEMMMFEQRLSADLAAIPDLAQRFFDAGPGKVRARLADILAAAAQAGTLAIDDPLDAASDLMALWQGFTPVEIRFGIAKPLSTDMIDARVARGVGIFLKACAPR